MITLLLTALSTPAHADDWVYTEGFPLPYGYEEPGWFRQGLEGTYPLSFPTSPATDAIYLGTSWLPDVDIAWIIPAGDGGVFVIATNYNVYWTAHYGDNTSYYSDPPVLIDTGSQIRTTDPVIDVFGGGDGVLYIREADGDLYWNRWLGYGVGPGPWGWSGRTYEGNGWKFYSRVVATGDGSVFAQMPNGELYYRFHYGRMGGTNSWSASTLVSWGWDQYRDLEPLYDDRLLTTYDYGDGYVEFIVHQYDTATQTFDSQSMGVVNAFTDIVTVLP